MNISKDQIKPKKSKQVEGKRGSRAHSNIRKQEKEPAVRNKASKQKSQVTKDRNLNKSKIEEEPIEQIQKPAELDYFDKLIEELKTSEHMSFKETINHCKNLLEQQRTKITTTSSAEGSQLITSLTTCINSILPKITQLEDQLDTETTLRQNAERDIDSLHQRIESLQKQAHKEDTVEEVHGEMPEDDYVKIVKKLELSMLKHSELEYEINRLRRITAQKDKVISGVDLSNVMLKIDKLVKDTAQIKTYHSIFEQAPTLAKQLEGKTTSVHDAYSLQPHTLEGKINTLECQIDILLNFFQSQEFQNTLKKTRKRKDMESSNNEQEEEMKLLRAEKTRLENYLKVYTQRINSLTTVVLFYQTQFKFMTSKFKQTLENSKTYKIEARHQTIFEDDDDDNESFAQYSANMTNDNFTKQLNREDAESVANTIPPVKQARPITESHSEISEKEVPLKTSTKGTNPDTDALNEIISFKNVLIQAQQEELDKLKHEIVRGNNVYVLMNRQEKEEWDKYRSIDTTFSLVEKLRTSLPNNVKWVDKNVHKVIQNIIKLKNQELVCSNETYAFQESIKDIKRKQKYVSRFIKEVSSQEKQKNKLLGNDIINQYALVLSLMNENCMNSLYLHERNFEMQEQLVRIKMRNTQLEDEIEEVR